MPPGGLRQVQLYNKLDATNDEVATGASAGQTGDLTPFHLLSANTINATVVKGSPGRLYISSCFNSSTSAPVFLKFYDTTSTPDPSAGSTSVWIHVLWGANVNKENATITWPHGLGFASGIAFVTVAGLASTDETAVAANQAIISLGYK